MSLRHNYCIREFAGEKNLLRTTDPEIDKEKEMAVLYIKHPDVLAGNASRVMVS